ncbi:hypothetical protein HY086_04690 [Candidatus Gottesmanbacteria bacterium]|nr:hypothetical protein [Candidatus Gottesmanbacteria bacterium]
MKRSLLRMTYGNMPFNANVSVVTNMKGRRMKSQNQEMTENQPQTQQARTPTMESNSSGWKTDTVLVNGAPLTIIFPQEED